MEFDDWLEEVLAELVVACYLHWFLGFDVHDLGFRDFEKQLLSVLCSVSNVADSVFIDDVFFDDLKLFLWGKRNLSPGLSFFHGDLLDWFRQGLIACNWLTLYWFFFLYLLFMLCFLLLFTFTFLLHLSFAFCFSLMLGLLATLSLFFSLAFLEGKSKVLMKALNGFASYIDFALRSRHQMQVHLEFLLCNRRLPRFCFQNFRGNNIFEVVGQCYLLFDEFDERVDG